MRRVTLSNLVWHGEPGLHMAPDGGGCARMEGVDARGIVRRGHCTHLLPEVPMDYALCHGSHTCYWCSRIVNRGTCHWEVSKPEHPRASREQIHSTADAGQPSPAPTISTPAFDAARPKLSIPNFPAPDHCPIRSSAPVTPLRP